MNENRSNEILFSKFQSIQTIRSPREMHMKTNSLNQKLSTSIQRPPNSQVQESINLKKRRLKVLGSKNSFIQKKVFFTPPFSFLRFHVTIYLGNGRW